MAKGVGREKYGMEVSGQIRRGAESINLGSSWRRVRAVFSTYTMISTDT